MPFEIKRNDKRPYWRVQLTQNGAPADITGNFGVKFTMKLGSSAPKINKQSMEVINASTGVVEYRWPNAGDTDTSGTFNAEVEVDWGGGATQTFPSKGYFTIPIEDDLA